MVELDGDLAIHGWVDVSSVAVKDPDLAVHLQSPEFFDAAEHPQMRFSAVDIEVAPDDSVVVNGELSIKGRTLPLRAAGSITPALEDPFGGGRRGLGLGAVIDRRLYGLSGTLPAPQGRPRARQRRQADRQPRVHPRPHHAAHPRHQREPARGSHNARPAAAAARCCLPTPSSSGWTGLAGIPAYNADDGDDPAARGGRPARRAGVGRRGPAQHARVQLLDPGPAQERAGLGVAPLPGQRPTREAGRGHRSKHGHVRRRLGPGELRKVLQRIGADVVDRELPVPFAHERFDASRRLADELLRQELADLVGELVAGARRAHLAGEPPIALASSAQRRPCSRA